VILDWRHTQAEAANEHAGHNVVLHEFAHQLDFLDGSTDGTPPLPDRAALKTWATVMSEAFVGHREALDSGRPSFFTAYAATNEAEFFASAVEAFYCLPIPMHHHAPTVYDALQTYFGLDPRAWFPA
jgi:hypothetical protein